MTKINLFELFHSVDILFTVYRDKMSEPAHPACSAVSELHNYNINCWERKYTVVCSFDKDSPRISAYDIPEQIYMNLRLEQEAVWRIQVDGPKRELHVKVTETQTLVDYYDGRKEVMTT
jgi:hypothetical protein